MDTVERDNEVARALLTKENPVLVQRLATERAAGRVEGKREGRPEGETSGLREAVRTACRLLAIELDDERLAELEAKDERDLREWLAAIERERRWPS